MQRGKTSINTDLKGSIDVACIGMLTPAEVYVVDQMPDWNTGRSWKTRADFISDDAAIVACCIKKWGLISGLVCNKLGNDISGQNVIDELESLGVSGNSSRTKILPPHTKSLFQILSVVGHTFGTGGKICCLLWRLQTPLSLRRPNVSMPTGMTIPITYQRLKKRYIKTFHYLSI